MAFENRQLLVIEVFVCLFAWLSIANVFWLPRLDALAPRRALRALVAVQMFRIVGLTLLANNVAAPGLDRGFAEWVATGDALTSALAIAAFVALGRRGPSGLVLATMTTVFGTFDIFRNLIVGTRVNAAEYIASGWLVVAVAVPLMLVAHVGAARVLVRRATWREAA